MEHFFHKVVRDVEHYYHKVKKHIPHHQTVETALASKNVRLAIILFIAAAIPFTVIAVQQVQDIRQSAANEPLCGTGAVADYQVSPENPTQGTKITFTGPGVNTETHGFGNNVDGKTCVGESGSVTCTAKGNFRKEIKIDGKSQNPKKYQTVDESKSTWFKLEDGKEVNICQYIVKRDTTGKEPTPPGGKPGGNQFCEGKIEPYCDGNNKPGLDISWEMKNGTDCKVVIKKATGSVSETISTDCGSPTKNQKVTKIGDDPINNNVTYQLVISDGRGPSKSCDNVGKGSATPKCKETPQETATPTPTKGGESPTPTPQSGQPPAPKNAKLICQMTNDPATTKLGASWDEVTFSGRNGYVYEIYDVTAGNTKITTKNLTGTEETHIPSGGSGNYTPIAEHTYKLKVAAKTANTTGVFSEVSTTCGKAGGGTAPTATPTPAASAAKLTPPENFEVSCKGTKGDNQADFTVAWSKVTIADSYHLLVKKGSTEVAELTKTNQDKLEHKFKGALGDYTFKLTTKKGSEEKFSSKNYRCNEDRLADEGAAKIGCFDPFNTGIFCI